MKGKLFRVTSLMLVAVLLMAMALPVASQEPDPQDPDAERPEDEEEPSTTTGDTNVDQDDTGTDGANFDDFVEIENPSGSGDAEVRLNGAPNDGSRQWDLENDTFFDDRLQFVDGGGLTRLSLEQGSGGLLTLHSGDFDVAGSGTFGGNATFGGEVGIGTTSPLDDFHIANTGNDHILLEDTDGASFNLEAGGDFFDIDSTDFPLNNFRIHRAAPSNALVVGEGIGIGTASPTGDLHVTDVDGSGRTELRVENASAGTTWSNQVLDTSGHYTFNRLGSGGPEFLVRQRQHPTATLDVDGPVRATVYNTSSKELKTNTQDVDSNTMLGKLNRLPVSSWQFKACKDGEGRIERADGTQPPPCSGEGQGPRHVGPMAEDFQKVFGLGDGESISTMTADGIMMLAIQELTQQLEDKDQAISELERDGEARDAIIAELEARLNTLESEGERDPGNPGRGRDR